MSRGLTKAELLVQLESSHVSYQRLSAEHDALKAEATRLREHVSARRYVRPVLAEAAKAHSLYAEALKNAKAMAIATGRVVRVG